MWWSGRGTRAPFAVELQLRCRKCERCLRLRRNVWSFRAQAETAWAFRTWFGTLTLRPDDHALVLAKARNRLDLQGFDYDALPYGEQFLERHRVISRWLTLYLKRVRKASGARLRHLVVAEAHVSGLPHYHALIHECSPAEPVRKRVLDEAWPHGFTKWRLVVDLREARYLCKYLSKASVARVRASLRYGTAPVGAFRKEVKPDHPVTTALVPEGDSADASLQVKETELWLLQRDVGILANHPALTLQEEAFDPLAPAYPLRRYPGWPTVIPDWVPKAK